MHTPIAPFGGGDVHVDDSGEDDGGGGHRGGGGGCGSGPRFHCGSRDQTRRFSVFTPAKWYNV